RLPKPIEHTRLRGIHAPTRSFGIIQTMLLALPNFGLERMGRKKVAAMPVWLYWARKKPKTKNQKPKTKNQKPKTKNQNIFRPQAAKNDSGCCGFSRPIRASPPMKKDG